MDKTQQGFVKADIVNGISTIEFFHPSHNSLPSNLLKALAETILSEGAKNEVIIIVLKSAGDRTFCAGASFDELASIENETAGKTFFMGFANVINAIRTCGKLVIGRVQGKAVGGGVGLASAVDYCVATQYGSIKLSELAVGIGPFVIGPAVERKVGLAAYSQMSLDATSWYDAKWAESRGLYSKVFESATEMDNYISSFSTQLSTMNPEALKDLKAVFWEGTENWGKLLETRAEMSGTLVLSEFSKQTIKGFLNA